MEKEKKKSPLKGLVSVFSRLRNSDSTKKLNIENGASKESRKQLMNGKKNGTTPEGEKDENITADTSPKAQIAHFTRILNDNIDHLQAICKEWEEYKAKESPSEEVCDMINAAIGQSQLLISKKFEQFRSLIRRCETKDQSAPVTCEDLHGFWDMVYIQVINLEKRFDNLKQLKENNWQETVIEKKVIAKPKAVKKIFAKPDSNLRDIIRAARELKKKQDSQQEINTFDAVSFSIISPARHQIETKKTARRCARKLAEDDLVRRNSFSGLKVLRAAINIKQITDEEMPLKSNLKSDSCLAQRGKSALFQNAAEEADIENDHTLASALDKTPLRRSRSFSK